jgi:A/G-specific adenine glycosylase
LLIAWYRAHGRDLPWRRTRDPYAILVAEIMLQQTQVDRVLPKYAEFLARFPTLAALAAAPPAEVIRAWAPLGYNRRAVQLQAIARQVLATDDGRIPDTVAALLRLKGIGRYTAGAIACFAYERDVATLDTNIRRVLHRVFVGLDAPEPQRSLAEMWQLAEQALPPGQAYEWNQALMDLGATVCTAANPACERCPLPSGCRAYAQMGQYSLFPSGAVVRDLRRIRERRPGYKTQPFTSSPRYYRGRILAALRQLDGAASLPLPELGQQIKPDFAAADLPWLANLATDLARDGLVRLHYTDENSDRPAALSLPGRGETGP